MKFGILSSLTVVSLAGSIGTVAGVVQTLEPSKIDVSELGPQVGEVVPDFSLSDHNGETWTRDAIMGPNGAMLVFVRSASW
jgi:hypothetical protein